MHNSAKGSFLEFDVWNIWMWLANKNSTSVPFKFTIISEILDVSDAAQFTSKLFTIFHYVASRQW